MDSIEKEKIDTATEPKDCFSCKMISGTVLLLASVHVFTRGASAKLRSTKLISAIFGTSLGYTGLARLLDLYPFNMKNMNMPNQESIKNVLKPMHFVLKMIFHVFCPTLVWISNGHFYESTCLVNRLVAEVGLVGKKLKITFMMVEFELILLTQYGGQFNLRSVSCSFIDFIPQIYLILRQKISSYSAYKSRIPSTFDDHRVWKELLGNR